MEVVWGGGGVEIRTHIHGVTSILWPIYDREVVPTPKHTNFKMLETVTIIERWLCY